MTHFILTVDPSPERRKQFLRNASEIIGASFASPAQAFEHQSLVIVSHTQEWEPFRYTQSAAGLSFIWGQAMSQQQSVSMSPDLTELWRPLPERMPLLLEGFHAAFLYRADGSWTVGADILGMVPIYYCTMDDCIVVGSSPELFRAHPRFQPKLDATGLVGIFLSNGLVDGRSLLQGVQRLASGKLLHARPQQPPRELAQYFPEASDRYFGASFEENYQRMEETLQDCYTRHLMPQQSYGLILSGGLDSRTVAGAMQQLNVPITAFSFGSKDDIEMQCAAAVARSLRFDHRMVAVRMERYPEYAEQECKWNHLANGLSTLMFREPIPDVGQFKAGMLSGFSMDHTIGASIINWAGNDPEQMNFGTYFKKVVRWSIPVAAVKRLVANSFGIELVDAVLRRMERFYNDCAPREFQKAWLFTHYHRLRYHTSAVLGLGSAWPWPVVPYLDTKMLDLMAGMPYEHVAQRRMQYHMIKLRFPRLARVPLDRNSFNMKPLVSPYGRVINHLLFKPREMFYRHTQAIRDRRFYYRFMDFNSPGWRAVRTAAEPHRQRTHQVLDEAALAEMLPRPDEHITVADGIIDSSKMKLLSGFLLWSANYL